MGWAGLMGEQQGPRWDPPDDWTPPTSWERPLDPRAVQGPERGQGPGPGTPPHAWPAPAASEQPAWYPPPPPHGDPPLTGRDRRWVPASHWIALFTSWLGPFIVLLTVGESSARVREHAKESLNFEITFWILMLFAAFGTYVLVGYVFLVLLPILWLVLRVLAALDAGAGKTVRYPFTLRLVR